MSFLFEEENLDLDFGTGEDVVETDDVDMGELEESYCEFITSCAALNEAAMIQEAKLLRESAGDEDVLEEGVMDTLKAWWKKFVDFCKRMWAKITAFFSRVWDKIRNLFISDEKWLEENAKALASVDFKPFKLKTYRAMASGKISANVKVVSDAINTVVSEAQKDVIGVIDASNAVTAISKVKAIAGDKIEVSITPALVKTLAADMPGVIKAGKAIKTMAGPLTKILKASEAAVAAGQKAVDQASKGDKTKTKVARQAATNANKILATAKDAFGKGTALINGFRSHGMKILHAAVRQPSGKKESVEFGGFSFAD